MRIAVKITNTNVSSKIKAFATLNIDNLFVVTGIKIIENSKGSLSVCMPSREITKADGTKDWVDIAYPITREARLKINETVLNTYQKYLNKEHDFANQNQPEEPPPVNYFEEAGLPEDPEYYDPVL